MGDSEMNLRDHANPAADRGDRRGLAERDRKRCRRCGVMTSGLAPDFTPAQRGRSNLRLREQRGRS